MRFKNTILIILLSICFSYSYFPLYCQENTVNKAIDYGFFINPSVNFHSGNFSGLPPVSSCCPKYDKGYGAGFTLGVQAQYALHPLWSIKSSFGYTSLAGIFRIKENTSIIYPTPTKVEIEHILNADLSAIILEPMLLYKPIMNMYVGIGCTIGTIISKNYTQEEQLISPSWGTFENNRRTRNQTSGSIPGINPRYFAFSTVLSYAIPISSKKSLYLIPQIHWWQALRNVTYTVDWKINVLSAGFGLMYIPYIDNTSESKRTNLPVISDPLPLPKIDTNKVIQKEMSFSPIKITEKRIIKSEPLLPYLFIRDSLNISRYSQKFNNHPYVHILDTIGKRMSANPGVLFLNVLEIRKSVPKKVLQNCTNIINYLFDSFSISKDRIKIVKKKKFNEISKREYEEGRQENNRIELTCSEPFVLRPFTDTILMNDTLNGHYNFIADPKYAMNRKIIVEVLSLQGDVLSNREYMSSDTCTIQLSPNYPDTIIISSRVVDSNFNLIIQDKMLQIYDYGANQSIDKQLSKEIYLSHFEYGSSSLSDIQKEEILSLSSHLFEDDSLVIEGFTDELGSYGINKTLAYQRAFQVSLVLNRKNVSIEQSKNKQILYGVSTPEERMYNRTVKITILRRR
jgi:outer membrane protein OmpA-like peptidoglycan-associated protein